MNNEQAETGRLLSLRDLCKTFPTGAEGKTVKALDGFSLDIHSGSFPVRAGKSGCGKTTLLKCIAGLETPEAGSAEFFAGGPAPKIGIMFQDPRLLPWLTVEKNLRLAFGTAKKNAGPEPAAEVADRAPPEPAAEIAKALELVGLSGWEKAYPRQLSGGMAQRASLARCLCRKPELLLLDEPLSALDSFTRARLRRELEGIWKQLGLTVILVTHDIEEAVYLGDRVILMDTGRPQAEFPVNLKRPRNYRDREFQELCGKIESAESETG
jgi:ABC-type nitrate/sulfonate/bicarbonate transport system ATPase subunit